MLKNIIDRWADWVGDRHLELAIHAQLREQQYAVHAAQIRDVRLVAVQRPGWVQVQQFRVETFNADKQPVTLHGLSRDDGRREKPQVLLSEDPAAIATQREQWSEGLIRRRG